MNKNNSKSASLPPVPKGLSRCEKCGHYKGDCLQDGVKWHISCICHRQICHRCRLPIYKYKIPSDIYDETNGRCLHVSIVCAWAHRCPDGVQGQLPNSMLIDTRTGIDILTGEKVLDKETLLHPKN